MKTKIIKVKGDWLEVLNDCRATVGKDPRNSVPSVDFRKRILIAEHSPIRDITIKWFWPDIKSWIATHFSRHKWECFIETQRSDRTGINREELTQGAPVSFTGEINLQHGIDTSRKRLCYLASPETRGYWEDFKIESHKVEPEASNVFVPNCIYRGGCPEMEPCGFFENFTKKYGVFTSIQERYDAYNTDFYERMRQ